MRGQVELHVMLAVLSGCDRAALDDAASVEGWLRDMVDAGQFTLFALEVTRFEPQGVTGMAVLGESHVAVHTWPEEGRLFVDITSCATAFGVRRAFEALLEGCPHASVDVTELGYGDASGFGRRSPLERRAP